MFHPFIALLTASSLFFEVSSIATAAQGTVTFNNSRRFMFDVDGNQIVATAGKVSLLAGKYYLYGNGGTGVNAYSSIDLVHWANEGALGYGGSRSHIIYNPTSKKYIVWADGAGTTGYIVGTSSSPAKGYTAAAVAPVDPIYAAYQKADMAVEVINGTGYLIYSTLNFQDPRGGSMWPAIYQTQHIVQLTDDYMQTTKTSYNVTSAANDLVDNQMESPDLFYRAPYYYVSGSNSCGLCSGSISVLFRSKSIQGPWTRQILAANGCNSQAEGVLPLTDPITNVTTYLWHGNSVPGSSLTPRNGHIFQPLVFNDDGSAQDLNCADDASFEVKFTLGDGAVASGKATQAADGSPILADYFQVCDSDAFNLYQTWTNSKPGTLKEIGVNVASTTQTGALNIKVFKLTNLVDFVSPGYKWTLLNSTVFTRAQTATTYNVVSVMLNAAVKQGEMLGVSYGNNYASGQFIAGGDTVPYCHLEYMTNDTSKVLFEQGAGQTSPRGLDGKTSVVVPRTGRGLKFYSIVS